jgi:hypothetical protein
MHALRAHLAWDGARKYAASWFDRLPGPLIEVSGMHASAR